MLIKDPENRLGAKNGDEEVLSHEWFADIDRMKVLAKDLEIPDEEKPQLESPMDLKYFNEDFIKMPVRETEISEE